MVRHRRLKASALFLALAALLYLLVSLYLPSSRRMIFGIDRATGKVRLVTDEITFLPPHQFLRLSFEKREGFAQRDEFVRLTSKEGVPVKIVYRIRFGLRENNLADSQRIMREGFSSWLDARMTEAVAASTSRFPIEDLVSPMSEFNSRRDSLRKLVIAHFARTGLDVAAFEIERIDIDRDALLRYKMVELRRNARAAISRVAVLAIDGADWELLQELMIDDRIPNIETLVEGGVTASVASIQPAISPMLWTTASTGLAPDRHGVTEYFDRVHPTVPVDAGSRLVPAVWDIALAFGRPTGMVNWWTTFPPPGSSSFAFDTPIRLSQSAIYPPELSPLVSRMAIPSATIGYREVSRFLNITNTEYQREINAGSGNPVVTMRDVLAKTWTDHRAAIELVRTRKPLLFLMSYEGSDMVNHLFGPYHPPFREGMSQENYRKYWPAVANYYSEIDRLIGEWMRALPPDTTVMIVSAHGMQWGKQRPRRHTPGSTALGTHRRPGVLIMYGNHVQPSRARQQMSLYDMTPTLLALIGLPQSQEMPGKVPAWAFKDITPVSSVRVASYGDFVSKKTVATAATPVAPKEYRESLEMAGHLVDESRAATPLFEDEDIERPQTLPPEKWGLYAHYNNLGVELKRQNKSKEAAEAFDKAIQLNPTRAVPYLNLSMVLFDRGQYSGADQLFADALARGLPNPEKYFVDMAALYRSRDMISRAINILLKGRQVLPESYLIAANLGSALASGNRYTEAFPELERALALRPSSTLALNNLGLLYLKKKDYGRSLDYWNRSLSINPQQPNIRKSVEAVRSHL